jgi:hypothetical protein
MKPLKRWAWRALRYLASREGYDLALSHKGPAAQLPDASPKDIARIERVQPFTMTSPARILALIEAVRYVVHHAVPGALVECGVWRGGSIMAALLTLMELGDTEREIFLFDTFEGMTAPSGEDRTLYGDDAAELLRHQAPDSELDLWCRAGRDEVAANLRTTGYPMDRIRLVAGDVTETLPGAAPDPIALLRLDTDWYASTAHELRHLYPRLSDLGVLIIDDYGHWKGARKATDEYFADSSHRPLLHRIDYTGRCLVKTNR